MKWEDLGQEIMKVCYIKGDFLLRSGQRSSEYFDKYQMESRPHLLKAVAEQLAPKIPKETQLLAGLEMGGIPIATALSLTTNLPMVMVRKEAKTYGTCRLAEGPDIRGKNLLVVEDVITTGGQVVKSVSELRAQGAHIDSVVCVIDRSEGRLEKLQEAGLQLHALFTSAQLKEL